MDIDDHYEFLKQVGERHKTVRLELGYISQGEYDMYFTGKKKNSNRISRIENGHNILLSIHSAMAYKLKVPLICLYDFKGLFEIRQYDPIGTIEDSIRRNAALFGFNLKTIRTEKKMSLTDLELSSGINNANISKYENALSDLKILTFHKLTMGLEIEHWRLTYDSKYPPIFKK